MAAALKRAYLSVYNWAVFFGWVQVLYFAVTALLRTGHQDVYAAVEKPLQLAQTAAVLEILHGLVGLVRSPVSATLPQIGSRLFVTWGILWSFPETGTHILVSSLVISWSITKKQRRKLAASNPTPLDLNLLLPWKSMFRCRRLLLFHLTTNSN